MKNILQLLNFLLLIVFLVVIAFFVYFYNKKTDKNEFKSYSDSIINIYKSDISNLQIKIDSLDARIDRNDSILNIKDESIEILKKKYEKIRNDIIGLDAYKSIDLFTKNYEADNKNNK